jgi:hypothetical protein
MKDEASDSDSPKFRAFHMAHHRYTNLPGPPSCAPLGHAGLLIPPLPARRPRAGYLAAYAALLGASVLWVGPLLLWVWARPPASRF